MNKLLVAVVLIVILILVLRPGLYNPAYIAQKAEEHQWAAEHARAQAELERAKGIREIMEADAFVVRLNGVIVAMGWPTLIGILLGMIVLFILTRRIPE